MFKKLTILNITLLSILGCPNLAIAQDNDQTISIINNEENPDSLNFSFGVPDSPALSLAGIEANATTTINQLSDFTLSIPSIVDGEEALALDVNLANILFPLESYEKTRKNYANRSDVYHVLRRTRVSFIGRAGNENADDPDESVRSLIATGISTSLLRDSDPLLSSINNNLGCSEFVKLINERVKSVAFVDGTTEAKKILGRAQTRLIVNEIDSARALIRDANSKVNTKAHKNLDKLTKDELGNEIGSFIVRLNDSEGPFRVDSPITKKEAESRETCYKAIDDALLNQPNLDVGGAILWRGDTDSFGGFESSGGALWTSYRHPLKFGKDNPDQRLVLGGTGRIGFDEFSTTGDDDLAEAQADTIQVWGGLELTTKNWNIGAQLGYVDVNFNDPLAQEFSRNGERWVISTEFNLSLIHKSMPDDVWLVASYGDAQGTVEALEGERLMVSLRFNGSQGLDIFE